MKKNKSLIRFILIVSLSGLIGGIIGFSVSFMSDSISTTVNNLFTGIYRIVPNIGIIFGIILCPILLILYNNLIHFTQNGIDDDEYYKIQFKKVNLLCLLTSVNAILQLYFIIIISMQIHSAERSGHIIFYLAAYLLFTFWGVYYQVKTINFLKKENPEKRGDPLESRFQKDWIESSDEAERLVTYHACYKSFQFMTRVYQFLFVILIILNVIISVTALPATILGACYLLHVLSYYYFIGKLSNKKLS